MIIISILIILTAIIIITVNRLGKLSPSRGITKVQWANTDRK